MSYTIIPDADTLQIRAMLSSQAEMMVFITALQKRAAELPETVGAADGETDGRSPSLSTSPASDSPEDRLAGRGFIYNSPQGTRNAHQDQTPAQNQIRQPESGDA